MNAVTQAPAPTNAPNAPQFDTYDARDLIKVGGKVRLGVDIAGFFSQHF